MRYYHGTTLSNFKAAYNPANNTYDRSKLHDLYSPKEFYFFKTFSFPAFLYGKAGAAFYAIWRASDKLKNDNTLPLIISGILDENKVEVKSDFVPGRGVAEISAVPVDSAFLGKRSGLTWHSEAILYLPGSFKKVNINDLVLSCS